MKMNSANCHLLVAGPKLNNFWTKIGFNLIWESNSVKLLGISINTFQSRIIGEVGIIGWKGGGGGLDIVIIINNRVVGIIGEVGHCNNY